MKAHLARLCVLAALSALGTFSADGQQRFESGPYKGFLREEPELNTVELPKPFKVSAVRGTIVYPVNRPLDGAVFEIRSSSGTILSATTSEKGAFVIPNVPPGEYVFKVTKNQFHSSVGIVVVSPGASRRKSIEIQLKPGT